MKKEILFLVALFVGAVAMATNNVFLQETETLNFTDYFVSFIAFETAILTVTGWLKNAIKVEDQLAQILSWAVALALAFGAWLFGFGIFEAYSAWWQVALVGALGGFAANGIFNTAIAQAFLALIKAK